MNRLLSTYKSLLFLSWLCMFGIVCQSQPSREAPSSFVLGRVAPNTPLFQDISSPQMEHWLGIDSPQIHLYEAYSPSVFFTVELLCQWREYYRVKIIAGENTYLLAQDKLVHVGQNLPELNDLSWRHIFEVKAKRVDSLHPYLKHVSACVQAPEPQVGEILVTAEEAPQSSPMLTRGGSGPKEEQHIQTQLHRVRKGETLWRIAQRYQTSLQVLRSLNGLASNTIYHNQQLKVPSKRIDQTHEVQSGETLWRIAQKHHTTVEELVDHNGLHSYAIVTGQRLRIPYSP